MRTDRAGQPGYARVQHVALEILRKIAEQAFPAEACVQENRKGEAVLYPKLMIGEAYARR